jgi:hypothetical protein
MVTLGVHEVCYFPGVISARNLEKGFEGEESGGKAAFPRLQWRPILPHVVYLIKGEPGG